MKKILLSLSMIVFVGAVVIGATGAFFSDTETSTGNTFTAGAIDLKIDNESYYSANVDGQGNLVLNTGTSWLEPLDLNGQFFFNFEDLKPGDWGEDTISLHVNNNDAYACLDVRLDSDDGNGLTEPEGEGGDNTDGNGEGELADAVNFVWWADDGDNVLEDGEELLDSGPLGVLNVGEVATVALADSEDSIFDSEVLNNNGALTGSETYYIGKAWCFGEFERGNLPNNEDTGPIVRGSGFSCDGSNEDNTTQTDGLTATISFMAVQSRNNNKFVCAPHLSGESQRPIVGANLGAYDHPTGNDCNVNVSDTSGDGEIQAAIDGAEGGETICVGPGTYNENVNINKSLTLSGDGAEATSVINGLGGNQTGAVMINASNVTVEGFAINGHAAGTATIFINSAVSDVVIDSNKLAIPSPDGLLTVGGVSDITVNNNEFIGQSGALRLSYVNGLASVDVSSDNVDLTNNTFSGALTGTLAIGHEASNSMVTRNVFDLSPSYAVFEAWMDSIALNENNFNGADSLKVAQMENVQTGDQGTVNAEDNWWGAAAPAGHISGDVGDDPKESIAFPEN